ncbi:MAG: efflux RND transporter periplasmic adaptor subunit [Verrucomicrobiota bacterium]
MNQLRFLALALAALITAGCGSSGPPERPLPEVSFQQPEVREVIDYDQFVGRLAPVEAVNVQARVSGYLQEIFFSDGQLVEEGDLLFQIDPRPFEAAVMIAEGALAEAQAQAKLAEKELARSERLIQTRAISREELDRRQQDSVARQGAVMTAEGQLAQAKLNLEFCQVKAPISGRISESQVDVGNLVQGGEVNATLLTSIVTHNPIYAYWDTDESSVLKYTRLVLSGDLPTVREKKIPVQLELADETDWPRTGYMDFAENRLDEATATIRVRAIFDNPDLLMTPGMFARVRVRASGAYDAMIIPDAAVGTDQDKRFVYVLGEEDHVEYRPVILGPRFGDERAIREGLTAEDWVATDGLQLLRPGAVVQPDKRGPPAAESTEAEAEPE